MRSLIIIGFRRISEKKKEMGFFCSDRPILVLSSLRVYLGYPEICVLFYFNTCGAVYRLHALVPSLVKIASCTCITCVNYF